MKAQRGRSRDDLPAEAGVLAASVDFMRVTANASLDDVPNRHRSQSSERHELREPPDTGTGGHHQVGQRSDAVDGDLPGDRRRALASAPLSADPDQGPERP